MKHILTPDRYRALRSLPEEKRLDYLKGIGLSGSDASDLLANLVIPSQKPYESKKHDSGFSRSETFKEILDRQEQLKSIIQPTPEDIQSEKERMFTRDIMLNQFLLGVSTRFDEASFNNPDIKKTYVTTWFYETFRLSHKQAALLMGDKGTGKTWGMLAYVASVTQTRGSLNKITWADSMFVTAFQISEWFHNSKKCQSYLDDVMKKKHLMIDDLGAEASGYRGSDFIAYFDYLFSERHKFKKNTYITTNANTEQLKALYGERFVSRFNQIGLRCETGGNDLRRPEG